MKNLIAPIALLLILLATATPFFLRNYNFALESYGYVYAAGAVILLAARLLIKHRKTGDMRLRRLYRLEVWVAIIFCVGAFFLFYNKAYYSGMRDWIAFTLAGAALQAYTSIAIPAREQKVK